jgi:hypothetical protein
VQNELMKMKYYFSYSTPFQMFMKLYEMAGTCGTHERDEKCIYVHWSVYGGIVSKPMLNKL